MPDTSSTDDVDASRRAFAELFPTIENNLRPHYEELCRRVGEKAPGTDPRTLVAAICAAVFEIATMLAQMEGEDHQSYTLPILRAFAEGHPKPERRKIEEIARYLAEPYKPRPNY